MTIEEIQALPTISDLNKFQAERIAELQAAGTYSYDALLPIIAERDAMIAREQVFYSREDGTDGFVTVYGNARERAIKRQAVR